MARLHVSSLENLKLDEKNANRGTRRGAEMLDYSLSELGAGRSILVDRDGHIIAGNKTVEAARRAGYKRVVLVPSDGSTLVAVQRSDLRIDSKKARELAIADRCCRVPTARTPRCSLAAHVRTAEGESQEENITGR
jgi:hypothetical protein